MLEPYDSITNYGEFGFESLSRHIFIILSKRKALKKFSSFCFVIVLDLLDKMYFKPQGIPLDALEDVDLGLDELEAIRLADFNGLYQEAAAKKMDIYR